ncbi:MAG: hypothetical protein C0504_01330 [Candidatus Solibacter sp.]|nr:hypothetical protein [Candidatus Solibacter sp.]
MGGGGIADPGIGIGRGEVDGRHGRSGRRGSGRGSAALVQPSAAGLCQPRAAVASYEASGRRVCRRGGVGACVGTGAGHEGLVADVGPRRRFGAEGRGLGSEAVPSMAVHPDAELQHVVVEISAGGPEVDHDGSADDSDDRALQLFAYSDE